MGSALERESGVDEVLDRTANSAGQIAVTGRYHRLPKRLEDDYLVLDVVLGQGYNGKVYMARNKALGSEYAVKDFTLVGVSQDKKEELASECEIFLRMDHPHVARLVDVYESPTKLSLVMERMEGGELFDRVVEKKHYSEKEAAVASYQMLLAVNYVHEAGIVHRDIKLENFLYERSDTDFLKLIDFGFSKIWDPDTKMKMSCGTLSYVAPEVLAKSYTSKCDMWSLGVVIFIVLCGYMPFSGSEENQVRKIRQGLFTEKEGFFRISSEARDFVRKLIMVDVNRRLSAAEALEHPWIKRRTAQEDSALDHTIVNSIAAFAAQSKFRRTCMTAMAWSLDTAARQEVRQAFLEMDTSKDGTISLAELRTVLEGKLKVKDEEVVQVFQSLDAAQDDKIHYSEFLAAMAASRLQMHDDLLQATFSRFDTNQSGYIQEEDLKVVLGKGFSDDEIRQMIAEADKNSDGKIDYQEFIGYMKRPGATELQQKAGHHIADSFPAGSKAAPGAAAGEDKPRRLSSWLITWR